MSKSSQDNELTSRIESLNLNHMKGRMLNLPNTNKNNEILLIYGLRSGIEQYLGLAQILARYGSVSLPDLPGFGGMDSLSKIGSKPTIDNLADYLASFVKWRYSRNHFSIVGVGFGFVVATRMLQKYPNLANKCRLVISLSGYASHDDFAIKPTELFPLKPIPFLLSNGVTSKVGQILLPLTSPRIFSTKNNSNDNSRVELKSRLWKINNLRTFYKCLSELKTLDNCAERINVPVYHVFYKDIDWLDEYRVEQHIRVIYKSYRQAKGNTSPFSLTLYNNPKEASSVIPPMVKHELSLLGN